MADIKPIHVVLIAVAVALVLGFVALNWTPGSDEEDREAACKVQSFVVAQIAEEVQGRAKTAANVAAQLAGPVCSLAYTELTKGQQKTPLEVLTDDGSRQISLSRNDLASLDLTESGCDGWSPNTSLIDLCNQEWISPPNP